MNTSIVVVMKHVGSKSNIWNSRLTMCNFQHSGYLHQFASFGERIYANVQKCLCRL